MPGNPKIVVDFVSDTGGLTSGFAKAETGGSKLASSLKGVGKAGAFAAGAAGVGALIYTVKTGIGEWQQSQKVTAQTQAVIKSTGAAANVTTKQVTDLAGAIMKKTGIDDEAVQSGENMLLTFTNIHNEVGKGNDVFDQATKAMTDMSVALGQDMTKSAMQLGKALNDPVKGMTALRRVGVAFTDDQQKQVKAMVASGDTMGAQKLILRELTKEFGGSAEAIGKTLPGQIAIARESFNNFAGDLVAKTIPYIERVITYLKTNWPAISQVLIGTWNQVKPSLDALVQALAALGQIVIEVVNLIKSNWGTIGPIVTQVVDIVKTQLKIVTDVLQLIAALLRGDWSQAWQEFKQIVIDVVDEMKAQITARVLIIKAVIEAAWAAIQALSAVTWNAIKALITTVWNGIQTGIVSAMNAIKTAVLTGWNAIKTVVTTEMTTIKTAIVTAWTAIQTAITSAQNALKGAITAAWNAIKGVITAAIGPISAAINTLAKLFSKPAEAAQTMLGGIRSAFGAIAGAIGAVIGAVGRAAQKLADAMMAPINVAKGAINAVLGRFNALRIPGFSVGINMPGPIPDINFSWGGYDLPDIPLLAKGAVISQPTLAMVGEGHGREIVAPEGLLRSILADQTPEIRVFIGDQELRGLVRTEIVRSDERIARTLLAGATA